MMKQVIVYDRASLEVRYVLDPREEHEDEALLALVKPREGEAALLYPKKGGGQDHLHSWRAAVRQAQR